jgi:hypothetical protein
MITGSETCSDWFEGRDCHSLAGSIFGACYSLNESSERNFLQLVSSDTAQSDAIGASINHSSVSVLCTLCYMAA